jgi:GDPmannose 4,6-dehydratase
MAFEHASLDWEAYVRFDERYERPTEVDALIGDYSKAKRELDWEPRILTPDLVRIMVDADVKQLEDQMAGRTVRIDQ